jgi:hypothetical protein
MRALVLKTQTSAKSRRQPFVNEIDATAAGITGRIANRTLFDGRRRTRYADDVVTTPLTVVNAADERPQHLPRDFEIEDRAAADRSMDFDAAWFAAQESCGLMPH